MAANGDINHLGHLRITPPAPSEPPLVVPRPGPGRRRLRTLKLAIGPGDDAEPVATILLPDED